MTDQQLLLIAKGQTLLSYNASGTMYPSGWSVLPPAFGFG